MPAARFEVDSRSRLPRVAVALGAALALGAGLAALSIARPAVGANPTADSTAGAASSPRVSDVSEFLERRCVGCHDAETKSGGLDLTALRSEAIDAQASTWIKIHDRVRDGEMPPPDEPRPGDAERTAFLKPIVETLTAAERARVAREGRVPLRRLTRVEFENTLRDLLALPALRVKESLPEDGSAHGFDRSAAALDTSFAHVEAYLAAVDFALEQALCPLPEKPPVFASGRMRFWEGDKGPFQGTASRKESIGLVGLTRDETWRVEDRLIVDDEPKATAYGMFRHEDADHHWAIRSIAPVLTGWHRVRVSGYSFGWDGEKVTPTDRWGALEFNIPSESRKLGTIGLPPNTPAVGEAIVWVERGGGRTHGTHDEIHLNPASCEKVRDFGQYDVRNGPPHPAPGVAVEWIEFEGPLHDQWPPASHHALFGDLPVREWTPECGAPKPVQQRWRNGNPGTLPRDVYGERGEKRPIVHVATEDPNGDAERLLRVFLRRAYRRPPTEPEVRDHVALVRSKLDSGVAFQDAMLAAYRRILTSPDFLLLREPVGRLTDHALAQRLSYFLWNSLPDDELSSLADRGELTKPGVLTKQGERMLADPKATRFHEDFVGQWLGLRGIDSTQPDSKLYPEFMPWLADSMQREAREYFAELLRADHSAVRLVKSDFAMLNDPLARWYGVAGVGGWELTKTPLPADSPRGGFLTMGGVLKVTANGTTTSPVKRGAFVMEKLLGIVPEPPPPDAGAIEPDVRGAVTIREQLDRHRRDAACAGCHRKMDGYGFALEAFDVAGEERTAYRSLGGAGPDAERKVVHGHRIEYHFGPPVDCAGTTPDGRAFANVRELRDLLASDTPTLARAFVGHLATYATGAPISFADRSAVEAIVARSKAKDYGLRTLLLEVVESDLFRVR